MADLNSSFLTSISQPAKNPTTEFFKRAMRESGVNLVSGDGPNKLIREQSIVVRDIEKSIQNEENVEKFIRGFKILIKREKYMLKALSACIFKKEGEDLMEVQQESLFRILLKVSLLQGPVLEILLDDLVIVTSNEDSESSLKLRLILSQLKYLPHIKNPTELTTKLLDIIEVATSQNQFELLDALPEIVPDNEYDNVAKELVTLLERNDDLSAAIVDCLNALNLSSDIKAQIQDHVLSKMLTGACTKTFSVFLDFLMTDQQNKNLSNALMKIRNCLNTLLAQNREEDDESNKIVVFNTLRKNSISKNVSEGWLQILTGFKTHIDHKPVDLIILFMLHSNAKLKKRTIEMTIRKRVKDGLLKYVLLEQLFNKFLPKQLLKDYFSTMIEIGSSLLRSSEDTTVTEFTSILFKLLFTHQETDRTSKQEILEGLVLLIGGTDQKNVTVILKILIDLLPEISKTPNHTIILMRVLEKLENLQLSDVRLVFTILATLTCQNDSLISQKEQLHMIIRKHLSSVKKQLKYRGIISAVIMAKHLACVEDDNSDLFLSEDSITSINQLTGGARDAAAILEMAATSAQSSPDLIGLYYDQLAAILIEANHLDKCFLSWLYETVTSDFQLLYVTETICEKIDDLEFTMEFNLNSEDEVDTPMGVNIAELALKDGKVVVLAPHFRLLRLLHYRQQGGDLSSIDALLGCAVILPKLEDIDSHGLENTRKIIDCLFHCINWFREVISGFVTQKNPTLRKKILQRIDNLLELERIVEEHLPNSHKLPHSYFEISPSQMIEEKIKPPPKKKKKTTEGAVKQLKKSKEAVQYREIDVDLIKLLKYPLEGGATSQITLTLKQFNFILKDYLSKLRLLSKNKSCGLSPLNLISTNEFMTDCSSILLNLNEHLKIITEKLQISTENELSQAFGYILECLSLIFAWSGFQQSQKLDLLRDLLKSLQSSSSNSVNHLITELSDRLITYTEYCTYPSQAVNLILTLDSLYNLSASAPFRSKIAKTAGKFLNMIEQIDTYNLDILIKSYLSSANVKSLCNIVGTVQDQANLTNKTDTLEMMTSVTKGNFYILYRNIWLCLEGRVKEEIKSLTNAQHLTLWKNTALSMQGLMSIVKMQETRANLICFLKKSVGILKVFLSQGIPILEIELKRDPDRVLEIFKTIQGNTRFLHHLCCYSKLTKDGALMSYVPQFRLTLESLIFRVKAALVANGCSEAFWMGNLKNRDLKGEDILSQNTEVEEEEEEEEELPSDEEDSDRNTSTSEVFQ